MFFVLAKLIKYMSSWLVCAPCYLIQFSPLAVRWLLLFMLMRAPSQPSLYRQGKEIKIRVHKYFSIFLFSFGLFI